MTVLMVEVGEILQRVWNECVIDVSKEACDFGRIQGPIQYVQPDDEEQREDENYRDRTTPIPEEIDHRADDKPDRSTDRFNDHPRVYRDPFQDTPDHDDEAREQCNVHDRKDHREDFLLSKADTP
jgi:hypothetical protein